MDVMSSQSSLVKAVVARLVASRSRVNRRIADLGEGALGESENRYFFWGLGEGASGESEILAETPFVFLVFV